YQLGRTDSTTWSHVKRAADFIVSFQQDGHAAPWTPQERWENQSGYSPATIAAEIAGLVCAAQIAQANGDTASAQRYLTTADLWHRYNFDGYGETQTGGPWTISQPDTFQTHGRVWPIFAGERGEYGLASGDTDMARAGLLAMAMAGNDGYLISEQVWDNQPPS